MKKIICSLAAILCLISCGSSHKLMTIKGTIQDYDGSDLMLLDAIIGGIGFKADENGKFNYTYDAGDQHQVAIFYGHSLFSLLVENGATSILDIDLSKDVKFQFSGDNAYENEYLTEFDGLYRLVSFSDPDCEDAWIPSSFKEYATAIDNQVAKLQSLLGQCSDKEFVSVQTEELETATIREKNQYIDLIDLSNIDSDYNSYMETIDRNSMSEAKNGQIRHYFTWLSKLKRLPEKEYAINYLTFIQKEISNQEVKNYLSTEEMKDAFTMSEAVTENLYNLYLDICDDSESREKIVSKYNQMITLIKGNPAPDFEIKDIDGNVVKLSDFKGKVLYVDFWASWCVFCCDEIPYLKEIYQKYKNNKKLEIISVSFDANIDDWKTAMDEYQQPWEQYVANGELNKIICDKYMISGIPRFLMIDADGNLISYDAPRPSDESLIEMIESNI